MAGPGEWFLESPLRPLLVPDGAGRIDAELSDGLHALFSVEGRYSRSPWTVRARG